MSKWEFADFEWEGVKVGQHRRVVFTHRENWTKLGGSEDVFFDVFRKLGEDGWELVSHATYAQSTQNTYWFKRPLA